LARPEAWGVWWERYVESKVDYKLGVGKLRGKMEQAGRDVRDILRWAKGEEDAAAAAEGLALLERVYREEFEETAEGEVGQRGARQGGAVHNPHDPEAQWSTKNTLRQKEWVGYNEQLGDVGAESAGRGTAVPRWHAISE